MAVSRVVNLCGVQVIPIFVEDDSGSGFPAAGPCGCIASLVEVIRRGGDGHSGAIADGFECGGVEAAGEMGR